MKLNYNPMENAYRDDPGLTHRGVTMRTLTSMEAMKQPTLTLHCIGADGKVQLSADDLHRLITFLTTWIAKLDPAEQTPAGYHYASTTGTRCMVSGGELVEIDRCMIDPEESSDEEIPYF